MMVTDLALRDMTDRSDARLQRLCKWLASVVRAPRYAFWSSSESPETSSAVVAGPLVQSVVVGSELSVPVDFARHRAGVAARRAIQLAQHHRFDEARSAFHSAMVADPRFDPGSVPGFWDLPRRGMFSAIEACEDLGRYHAAALLEVRILQASRPPKDVLPGSSAAVAAP
jgi:hypothetical protein